MNRGKGGTHTNQAVPKVKEEKARERESSSTTPSNPTKAGKLAGRRLAKSFVCEFCEKKFATKQALDAHASVVHEVEDIITFAFEDEESGQVMRPLASREVIEEARSELVCTLCSDGVPLGFPSQAALDAHIAQQHGDRLPGNTPPAQTSIHVETKWCTHCAKYLGTKEKLAHHIKTKHNDVVVKEDDGKMHTKVVRFRLDDVADASNCSNTPAYNVLCPEDSCPRDANPIPPGESHEGASTSASRPQDANPTPPGEINVGASTSTSSPVQGPANRECFNCEQCGKPQYSWKALHYHSVQAHGVRVCKKRKRKKKGELNSASDSDQSQSPLKRRKRIPLCRMSSPPRR
ncbi:hypothetical protein TNCV_4268311 [Trichonephila clavipes]|nr:hypothetical protein TNCV_4268311 [Trichonephila clavipes]